MPVERRVPEGFLTIRGARANNLKGIDVKIPLGVFTCVTGVSGSGKSSLVNEILYKALARDLNRAHTRPGPHDRIEGIEQLDKILAIDQSPIGRAPRSNPATYTGSDSTLSARYSRPRRTLRRAVTRPTASHLTLKAGAVEHARATA